MPLPNPSLYIRLVQVEDADTYEGTIKCSLTSWSISEAPAYQAISYTWGDPDSTSRIIVNGKNLQVHNNCEYALRQARWHGGSQYIWIDSICINQADIEERGRQVAQMDRVFRNSTCILACLGPHSDESDFLMTFLGKHADFLTNSNPRDLAPFLPLSTDEEWVGPGSSEPEVHAGILKTHLERESRLHIEQAGQSLGWGAGTRQRIRDWRNKKKKMEMYVPTSKGYRQSPADSSSRYSQIAKAHTSQGSQLAHFEDEQARIHRKINIRYTLSVCQWRLKVSNEEMHTASRSYSSLVNRPYFSRVWVMQEV